MKQIFDFTWTDRKTGEVKAGQFELTVDMDTVAREVGGSCLKGSSGRAVRMRGAIKAKRVGEVKIITPEAA